MIISRSKIKFRPNRAGDLFGQIKIGETKCLMTLNGVKKLPDNVIGFHIEEDEDGSPQITPSSFTTSNGEVIETNWVRFVGFEEEFESPIARSERLMRLAGEVKFAGTANW